MAPKKQAKSATATPYAVLRENPILAVIDAGYGFLKFFSSVKPVRTVIPAAVDVHQTISPSNLTNRADIDLNELVVEISEGEEGSTKKAYVGQRALESFNDFEKRTKAPNRAKDEYSRILFRTALALTLPDEEGDYNDVRLVTGLPNKDYDSPIRKELETFLLEPFSIKFYLGGRVIEKRIKVSKLLIVRQPEGAVMSDQFVLGDVRKEGETLLMPSENYVQNLGVIDIGQETTDYSLAKEGQIVADSQTTGSTRGSSKAYSFLKKALKQKLQSLGHSGYNIRDKELDMAVIEKKIVVGPFEYTVAEEVQNAADDAARLIAPDIFESWEDELARLQRILLSGGGALLFKDSFKTEFANRSSREYKMAATPQFANLEGYFMYGVLLLIADELGQDVAYELYVETVEELLASMEEEALV